MPTLPRAGRRAALSLLVLVGCNSGEERAATDTRGYSGTDAVMTAPSAAPAPPGAPRGVMGDRPAREEGASGGGANAVQDSAVATGAGQGAAAIPTMLIRTGDATLEVDSLEVAITRVQQLAQRLGGFVAGTNVRAGEGERRSAMIQLKLPNARFDEATNALAPIGTVEALAVSTQDVGEEFVDVTARAENARRLEQRLIELLARRTGKLEEVLQVERELARVREEIERYEGRLRYLRSRVALSTLTITVHEPRPILDPRPGPSPIGEAFRQAWRNFVAFVAGFIAVLGWLVPLVAIVGLLTWAWRRWMPRPPVPPFGPHRPHDDRDVPARGA